MLDLLEGKTQVVKRLKHSSTIGGLAHEYMNSKAFARLKGNTQKEYELCLRIAMATPTHTGKTVGETKLNFFGNNHANYVYEQWLDRGVSRANKISAILSIVFNRAINMDILNRNPMKGVTRVPNKQRKVMWTQDQVFTFLDTAYSQNKWRSIGLIVQMAYEWGQRIGDMRLLTWDKLDLDNKRMDIEQSKRSADVHLPISEPLLHVLCQQKEAYGFQEYVAPQMQPSDGAYKPYKKENLFSYVNDIKDAAGLPSELTAMDMRRTAITEMVEAGVDVTQIKQVSGHKSISSLDPYIKHTFSGASNALAQRQAYKDNNDE
jgi:integrase